MKNLIKQMVHLITYWLLQKNELVFMSHVIGFVYWWDFKIYMCKKLQTTQQNVQVYKHLQQIPF
jgi:hypothetical protein